METVDRPAPPTSPPAGDGAPPAGRGHKKGRLVKPRAFRLLWDAHSVTGIVIGLALFVIFYAGAFALYRGELHAWADPALRAAEVRLSMDEAAAPLFAAAPPAPGTDVQVTAPFRGRPFYYVRYQTPAGDTTRQVTATVNPATGEAVETAEGSRLFGRSALSEMLYDLHFFGQAGIWGEILSGFVAVSFLVAVVSGVLIHLRKLPKDWHTFRPRGTLRDALADAHTVLGLVGVPFAAMYAVTGAFLSLLLILLAPTVLVVFGGDQGMVEDLVAGFEMPPHDATGEPAEMLPLEAYADAAREAWGGAAEPSYLMVHGWGDRAAIAQVHGVAASSLTAAPQVVLQATTAEVLVANSPTVGPPLGGTTAAVTNLHYATFGGPLTKVLYFLLALATGAVILTGNVLWVLVRRPKDGVPTRLHRALARLTVGVGCGLVAAVPVLFLTTVALLKDLPSLQTWEHVALFGTWAVLIAAAFAGRSPVAAARWQLALAGVLSLLVPVANGAFTGAWPWATAAGGLWDVFVVDVGFLVMGPALLWTARRLRP